MDSYYTSSFRLDVLYSDMNSITAVPVLTTTEDAVTVNKDSGEGEQTGKYNISVVLERVLDNNSFVKMYVSGSTLLHEQENYLYNEDICGSVLSGMLKSESYVEIPSKTTNATTLHLNTTDFVFIIILVALIAIGVLIFGIVMWRKRRYL